jgi:hypothetical protein
MDRIETNNVIYWMLETRKGLCMIIRLTLTLTAEKWEVDGEGMRFERNEYESYVRDEGCPVDCFKCAGRK